MNFSGKEISVDFVSTRYPRRDIILTYGDTGHQEYRDLAAEVQQHAECQITRHRAEPPQAHHHAHRGGGYVRWEDVDRDAGDHEIRRGRHQREYARGYQNLQRGSHEVHTKGGDASHQHRRHWKKIVENFILIKKKDKPKNYGQF